MAKQRGAELRRESVKTGGRQLLTPALSLKPEKGLGILGPMPTEVIYGRLDVHVCLNEFPFIPPQPTSPAHTLPCTTRSYPGCSSAGPS